MVGQGYPQGPAPVEGETNYVPTHGPMDTDQNHFGRCPWDHGLVHSLFLLPLVLVLADIPAPPFGMEPGKIFLSFHLLPRRISDNDSPANFAFLFDINDQMSNMWV